MAETNMTDKNQPIRTAQFNASVGEEQLSYICAYCGKVNPITAGKCLRCGKRRPRNEYLNALNKSKQAEDFKESLAAEMAQAELDRKEAQDMQLVRLVEERVADEKAQIEAQEAVKRDQDRDAVQRLAARDAALRVIEAERRADEAIAAHSRETEEIMRQEREKTMYAAAQKIVSERAGIEQAAEERINIVRAEMKKEADRSIAESVDAAEKDAARRAVLKIIAAEQDTEDRLRMERESTERAAMDRIKEETDRIAMYEQAKHEAEKEGIQRAVEERLRAEREIFGKSSGTAAPAYPSAPFGAPYAGIPQQNPVTIQPLAIVPYLNSQQPLYQYDPNQPRTMYKFIPDPPPVEETPEEEGFYEAEPLTFAPVKEKKGGFRILGILQIILSAIIIFFAFFGTTLLKEVLEGGGMPLAQIQLIPKASGLDIIFPILMILVIVMAVISLVQGVIRLVKGRLLPWSWLVSLVLLLLIVGSFAVFVIPDINVKDAKFGPSIWLLSIYLGAAAIMLYASMIAHMVWQHRKHKLY